MASRMHYIAIEGYMRIYKELSGVDKLSKNEAIKAEHMLCMVGLGLVMALIAQYML